MWRSRPVQQGEPFVGLRRGCSRMNRHRAQRREKRRLFYGSYSIYTSLLGGGGIVSMPGPPIEMQGVAWALASDIEMVIG